MNENFKNALFELKRQSSFTKNEIKKIYKCIPVPSDYNFIDADIKSLNGYPVGIVITEEALIIKASKEYVKELNKKIKQKNKSSDKTNRRKKISEFYQIIPWEYYSIEDFTFNQDANLNTYFLKSNNETLYELTNKNIYNIFNEYQEKEKKSNIVSNVVIENAALSAIYTINSSLTYFSAKNGIGISNKGHGFYAEEAGSILDKIHGERSTVIGYDNAPNGPDKLLNGINVQCKYCKTSNASLNECFKNGKYRYYNIDGSAMMTEVPADQYEHCIELMKEKINENKVPGVTDEKQAYALIRKGKFTYAQVKNLAKVGTIESLTYDTVTGAVNCLWAFGISSLVSFFTIWASTKDIKLAAKGAIKAGLCVYGSTLFCSILSSQLAKTALISALDGLSTASASILGYKNAQSIINAYRRLAGLKPIYGAAANASFKRYMSANIITNGVMLIVFSIPDTFKVINKRITSSQYFKNMIVLIAGLSGTALGTIGTGALLGTKIGRNIGKTPGKIIGSLIGTIVGLVASIGTKRALDTIHEDDNKIMFRMFNALLATSIIENMLSEDEQDELFEVLSSKNSKKELKKLLEKSILSKNQSKDINKFIDSKIDKIIKKRLLLSTDMTKKFEEEIVNVFYKGNLDYGM